MYHSFSDFAELRKSCVSSLQNISPEGLKNAIKQIVETFANNGQLYICGNGGSAADAQHIAAEFINGMNHPNNLHLPAIALTTDTSVLTAHSNDYNFHTVFEVQLKALAKPGDCALFLTTSGKSKNILKAIEYCARIGLPSIVLTGENTNLDKFNLICIKIPAVDTQIIQEMSLIVEHYLCGEVITELRKFKINSDKGIKHDIN